MRSKLGVIVAAIAAMTSAAVFAIGSIDDRNYVGTRSDNLPSYPSRIGLDIVCGTSTGQVHSPKAYDRGVGSTSGVPASIFTQMWKLATTSCQKIGFNPATGRDSFRCSVNYHACGASSSCMGWAGYVDTDAQCSAPATPTPTPVPTPAPTPVPVINSAINGSVTGGLSTVATSGATTTATTTNGVNANLRAAGGNCRQECASFLAGGNGAARISSVCNPTGGSALR